jgi:hypothetical protein
MQTSLGFVSPSSLVVAARPSGGTWRVDVGTALETFPLQSVVANDPQRSPNDFAGGVHLAADGNWLYVQEPLSEQHHYLGYTNFDPQFASLSPDGTHVAWTNGNLVFVEATKGGDKSLRLQARSPEAYFRASFIDDQHLVAVDYSGGLHLIDWQSGKEVGTADAGGPVREIEVDQSRHLIRGIRQNGGSWVAELSGSELAGPYLVQDQSYRAGFLDGEQVLWTIDAQNAYHSYTLAELRSGVSTKRITDSAEPMTQGAPMAIDRQGMTYYPRAVGIAAQLDLKERNATTAVRSIDIPWTPMQVRPSPDGSKIALLSSNAGIVKVVDSTSGKTLWSMSFIQGVHHIEWSVDSKTVAVASQVGAVVHDGTTGEQIRKGCGPWFEKRSTPPPSTLTFLQVQNLCER